MPITRKRGWLAAAGVVVLAGFFLFFTRGSASEPVRVAPVRQEPLASTLTTNGKVQPGEWREVRAAAPAFIRRLLVKEGDVVRRGQLIAELERGQASAEAARARAELEAAEAEAQATARGGTGAELYAQDQKLREARMARDEARRTLQANERLLQRNAIPRQEVEQSRERVRQLDAEVAHLEQRTKRAITPEERERARARVNSARAAVAYASQQLGSTRVTAPLAGTVYSLPVQPGQYLNMGDVIARVGKLDRVRVVVYVDEPELGRVAPGQEVRVTWSALPGQEWRGTVERVPAEVVMLGTRSVGEVVCTVENTGGKLLANVNVDAEIVLQRRPGALSVPKEAVVHEAASRGAGSERQYVFVVQDGAVRRRDVKLGVASPTRVEITSGLAVGDKVALPGELTLRDGMKVRVVE